MAFKLTPKRRLMATIVISFSFFVAEIAVAFMTRSLVLLADAFHYMNDLVGFIVALIALMISERSDFPQDLSFGWQRARLLGAFFNGVFLIALGISILLQSIERFISLQHVQNPKLVLIMGCIGFGLNIISAAFLHEHGHGHDHGHGHGSVPEAYGSEVELIDHVHADHRHQTAAAAAGDSHGHGPGRSGGRDLNMLGALIHVAGDAINNLGVILAALVIWKTHSPGRFYADPAVSTAIGLMILASALPLVRHSGAILLESAPRGVDVADVRHDLETIPGIASVHELHIWRLDQHKAIASAHVVVADDHRSVDAFMAAARTASQCLHAYGIHSFTLQPERAGGLEGAEGGLEGGLEGGPEDGLAEDAVPGPVEDTPATLSPTPSRIAVTPSSHSHRLPAAAVSVLRRRQAASGACQIPCGTVCEDLMCCK